MTKDDRLRVMGLIGNLGDLKFLDREGNIDPKSVSDFRKLAKKLYLVSFGGFHEKKPNKDSPKVYDAMADTIVQIVNEYFGIDLTEKERVGINIRARKLTCLLLKAYTTLTYKEMGAFILKEPADHTTVLHHLHHGVKLITTNAGYKFDFEALMNMVSERFAPAEEAA